MGLKGKSGEKPARSRHCYKDKPLDTPLGLPPGKVSDGYVSIVLEPGDLPGDSDCSFCGEQKSCALLLACFTITRFGVRSIGSRSVSGEAISELAMASFTRQKPKPQVSSKRRIPEKLFALGPDPEGSRRPANALVPRRNAKAGKDRKLPESRAAPMEGDRHRPGLKLGLQPQSTAGCREAPVQLRHYPVTVSAEKHAGNFNATGARSLGRQHGSLKRKPGYRPCCNQSRGGKCLSNFASSDSSLPAQSSGLLRPLSVYHPCTPNNTKRYMAQYTIPWALSSWMLPSSYCSMGRSSPPRPQEPTAHTAFPYRCPGNTAFESVHQPFQARDQHPGVHCSCRYGQSWT